MEPLIERLTYEAGLNYGAGGLLRRFVAMLSDALRERSESRGE